MGRRLTAALQAIRLTHRSVGIIIVGGGRIVVDENAKPVGYLANIDVEERAKIFVDSLSVDSLSLGLRTN